MTFPGDFTFGETTSAYPVNRYAAQPSAAR